MEQVVTGERGYEKGDEIGHHERLHKEEQEDNLSVVTVKTQKKSFHTSRYNITFQNYMA